MRGLFGRESSTSFLRENDTSLRVQAVEHIQIHVRTPTHLPPRESLINSNDIGLVHAATESGKAAYCYTAMCFKLWECSTQQVFQTEKRSATKQAHTDRVRRSGRNVHRYWTSGAGTRAIMDTY